MRIVVVDRSRTVLRIITDLIRPGGHDVIAFTDGREALEYIGSDGEVRAVITSGELDSLSGIELCVAARNLAGSHRPLYIILMSSSDDHDILVQALDHGADDFIRKPPVSEELRARLRAADRVTLMQGELIRYATTDFLSGLLNRREFFRRATEACMRVQSPPGLSALIFDIDHFKSVNDSHGHDVGDLVIAAVARQAQKVDAIAGRLGGEEFCLLTCHQLAGAIEVAQQLQRSISEMRCAAGGKEIGVTCSFGVAEWQPGDTIDALLRRADVAMYKAKSSGRNCVIAANSRAVAPHQLDGRRVVRALDRYRQ
jgi:two-component system, cell cycle response regulator